MCNTHTKKKISNLSLDIPFTATPSCCCSNESKPEYHQIDYLSLGLNPVGNDHNSSPNSSTTRDLTLHLYNASGTLYNFFLNYILYVYSFACALTYVFASFLSIIVPHPSPLTPVTLIQSPTPDKTQKTFLTRKKR